MKRNTEPSYIMQFALETEKYEEDEIDKRYECGRMIYNALLTVTKRRWKEMVKTKEYRTLTEDLNAIIVKIKNSEGDRKKALTAKKKTISDRLTEIRKRHKINEFAFYEDVKRMQWHYKSKVHSHIAQSIATNLWKAYEALLFRDGKEIHYKKYGQLNALEGRNNDTGIVFKDDCILWNKLKLKVKINYGNPYEAMAMRDRIAYCRIVRKYIRGRHKYYVQLLLKGHSPPKIDKNTGELKRELGIGDVGIDIGTQTIAISSATAVNIYELADRVQNVEKAKRRIQRKMDRSRRATNPDNFSEDGTIKNQGAKKVEWAKSKRYIKLQDELREIHRKQAAIRKCQHETMANEIISHGDRVYVEAMNFKGLQKKAKKTEKSDKGKYKRRKRFGKSIANKAPAMLLEILKRKLEWHGTTLTKIDTKEVKASQYNHVIDEHKKKKLNERWNDINGEKIQRDMYSAFLIMNVNSDLKTINKDKCNERYATFKEMHDKEVQRLTGKKNLSSIAI